MAEGQRGIDVRTLNMQQLQSVRKNLVEEVQMLVGGLQQLKVAQSKLLQAQESVDAIKPENKGKDIMMPLTGSMYVPAKLDSIESVMVELGTGYFVEKVSIGVLSVCVCVYMCVCLSVCPSVCH